MPEATREEIAKLIAGALRQLADVSQLVQEAESAYATPDGRYIAYEGLDASLSHLNDAKAKVQAARDLIYQPDMM